MSLIDAAERFAAMDRSAIVLDGARCLHSLDRSSGCEACFLVCPVQAILPGKPPVLDTEKCASCLACLTVCPVGAYSADDAVTALLNSVTHVEGKVVELVCSRNPHPEKGTPDSSAGIVVKGCLAGLGTGAYVALAPFGLERVVLRTEACASCEWAPLRSEIDAQAMRARDFLAAWDIAVSITASDAESTVDRPCWAAGNPPLSRRELFRMMARQGQVAMARAMEDGVRSSGRRPGRDRLRLLAGAAHLPAAREAAQVPLGTMSFAAITVTDACSACGACGRACPTEALKFEKDEEETRFSVKFSARLCVGCDLCTRVCVPQAVTVDHAPAFSAVFGPQEVQLLAGELVRCKRCGALTAKRTDTELCDLCEFRRTHPFGSMFPPGFKPDPSGIGKQQA